MDPKMRREIDALKDRISILENIVAPKSKSWITEVQIKKVKTLTGKGHTTRSIASLVGISASSVHRLQQKHNKEKV